MQFPGAPPPRTGLLPPLAPVVGPLPYGSRILDTPAYDTYRLREYPRGIQTLADAGYDVQGYLERYHNKQEARKKKRAKERERIGLTKPFIAWDGEGWTDTDGEHRYMYMANSLGQYMEAPELQTKACLNFLCKTGAQYPGAIHVIYGGGYDVTHWLRHMHYMWRDVLIDYSDVSWEGYRIKYVPNKWFTVSRTTGTEEERRRESITVWDVMTFYQSSFIKALQSRGLSVPAEIEAGKAGRNSFTLDDLPFIHTYTGHELRLLVELCESLRAEFHEADIPLERYHGPGAVANAVMKQKSIINHKRVESDKSELLCMRAYFGGRFEPFKVGHYEGQVFQADIGSAYPHKIAQLPSLRNSHWEYRSSFTGELGVWRTRYHNDGDLHRPHPIPWRASTGAVGFPSHVDSVWLWTYEAVYADAQDGYALILDNDERPFEFVTDYYQTRKQWKAEGRGGAHALKLAMNSLYGKMAQREGSQQDGPPRYHQLAWAGMVTSATRAQLWDAMQLDPESVIAVETDSVTSTRRLDGLDYTPELGAWELAEYDWLTYLQSGVYWTNQGQNTKIKTRGISAGELNHDQVMAYLAGDQSEPLVTTVRRFIGITNPQRAHYGQWLDTPRELALSSGGKRIHDSMRCPECARGIGLDKGLHTMFPNPVMGYGDSKPHPLPWREDVDPNTEWLIDENELLD